VVAVVRFAGLGNKIIGDHWDGLAFFLLLDIGRAERKERLCACASISLRVCVCARATQRRETGTSWRRMQKENVSIPDNVSTGTCILCDRC
jgi:hypothetical protein